MTGVVEGIKKQISCREFAESVGLKVNRSGFTVCPFHGDKDASLKIYDGDRGWCCFGCHKGGDVINFASLYYGLPFMETLQKLNDDFHLGLMERGQTSQEIAVKRAIAAVEIARRKAARAKEERLQAALEAAYWAAFDKWLDNERTIRDKAPQSPDEEFDQDFVRALINRDAIRDELETIELRRMHL